MCSPALCRTERDPDKAVRGQCHRDDRLGRMPAPEQIVFPAVLVLGIARVDPRTDDLVPFDGPTVVPEQVGPDTPDQRDPLELVVGGERRKRIKEGADLRGPARRLDGTKRRLQQHPAGRRRRSRPPEAVL